MIRNKLNPQSDIPIENLRINYGEKILSYLTNPEIEPYPTERL